MTNLEIEWRCFRAGMTLPQSREDLLSLATLGRCDWDDMPEEVPVKLKRGGYHNKSKGKRHGEYHRVTYDMKPGEVRLKEFIQSQAIKLNRSPDAVRAMINAGKYHNLNLRKINRRCVCVTPATAELEQNSIGARRLGKPRRITVNGIATKTWIANMAQELGKSIPCVRQMICRGQLKYPDEHENSTGNH